MLGKVTESEWKKLYLIWPLKAYLTHTVRGGLVSFPLGLECCCRDCVDHSRREGREERRKRRKKRGWGKKADLLIHLQEAEQARSSYRSSRLEADISWGPGGLCCLVSLKLFPSRAECKGSWWRVVGTQWLVPKDLPGRTR